MIISNFYGHMIQRLKKTGVGFEIMKIDAVFNGFILE
jgi:hypothetical protein